MLALLGKATKTGKAVNIGRKLLAKGGKKEQKKKDDRRRYSEPSSSLVPRGSAAPKNTSVLAPVPKLAEVNEDTAKGDDDILVIKDTVISIHKILKTTFKNESILLKQRRKSEENRKRAEQEEELEAKKEDDKKEKSGGGKMNVPMSIMDRIKAFIAGFVAYRLVPFIPQLLELVKFIPPVVDFFANTGIFLIDAFSSFLVIAKKPIDWAKGAIENIGGEEALEKFEGLLSAFTTFANIAIIAGMASIGGGDKGGGLFGRRGGKGPGPGKGLTGISGKGVGQTRTTSPAAARRFARKFGRGEAEKRFGKDAVKSLGGKYGRSRVTNVVRKGATGIANKIGGRGGVKALASLGKIGKFLKVPVIGSIISVVLSLMNGDPIQKALFKGVGTAAGTALGGVLSTFIGVPPLGMFLGGIIGDYVGDLLYTLFFGGGLKAAGAKLGNDLKGMFMGIGQGAKAIFDWVFGGGLFSLLKNVGGGIAKFALYLLNPGGLLWDILKAGGNALKAITGFVFGGGLFDLIKNITGGVFKFITYILNPGGLLFDALKQGGKIAKAIFDFAINAIGSTVQFIIEGTKKATGGIADALTFNLFDFDKQNKVEKKEEGGPVGDTETSVEKNLERTTFKTSTKKPDKVKIGKDIGGPEKLVKAGFNKKTVGYLAAASDEMKRIPLIGSIMGSAIDLLLGQRPEKSMLQSFSTNIVALNDFATVDEVNQGSLTGLLSASAMQTGGEVFGSTYGPGTIAGERDSATGALLATDPDQYQVVLSRYLETAVDNKVPNVFNAMNLAETMKENEPGPFDSILGGLKDFFGFGSKKATDGGGGDDKKTSKSSGGITMGSDFESTLARLLKDYEGLRTEAYKDSKGIPTIGMGATYYPKGFRLSGSVQMGQTITEEEALYIKQQHIKEHRDRLLRDLPASTYAKVPDNVKAALESKVFNYGSLGGTLADLVTKATEDGNYKPVSDYFRNTLAKHDGGLNSWRRNDEADIIDTGTSSRASLSFPKQSGAEATKVYEAEVAKASSGSGAPDVDSSDMSTADVGSRERGEGSKLAGELGRFLDAKGLGDYGSGTHQHPEHPPWPAESGHSANSLHYESQGARALDIGGWGPNLFKRNGESGTDDQTKIIAAINEFNSSKGVSPVEFLHEGNEPGGHSDHVHIAYQGGGSIGSRKSDTASISDYAPYEDGDSGPQIIVKTIIVEKKMPGESVIMPLPLGGGGSSDGVNINAYSNLSAGAG